MKGLLLSLLFAMSVSLPAYSEVVVPHDGVINGVTIRSQPSTSSAPRGMLRPGDELPFEGAVPRWNRVRLSDGTIGFVSKSWTDVVNPTVAGLYTIHAVDVGTGLAVVVEGPDFVLVYDGGSNDDLARGNENRLLAYLRAAVPNLETIDHIVLSHPHRDHVELLPDLFDVYDIEQVWDSGRLHSICGYQAFLEKVASEPGVNYHNALGHFGTHDASFPSKQCYGQQKAAALIQIPQGARIDDTPIALGNTGQMQFLYADGTQHSSPNENSLVLRLDLGMRRVLFMGDAEAGGRQDPSHSVSSGSIEGTLLDCCRAQLQADILVVGHHGSMTSSRAEFLDAVQAGTFVISSGPKRYGQVTLPDQEVVTELSSRGTVWRTDLDDEACKSEANKIGPDADGKPGGCHNVQLHIGNGGLIEADFWVPAD